MSVALHDSPHLHHFPSDARAAQLNLSLPAPAHRVHCQGLYLSCESDVLIGRAFNGARLDQIQPAMSVPRMHRLTGAVYTVQVWSGSGISRVR